MAINGFARAAIKAFSRVDWNLEKTYPIERTLKMIKAPILMPIYKRWDYKIYAGDREILTRVFSPKKGTEKNTIIFFHGGGWVTENIDSYSNICKCLSRHTDSLVISVEYRLAPEHPFPQGLEDCYTAASFIYEKHRAGDTLPGKLFLMGDSAGGNLAAAVSLRARDRKEFQVDGQVLLYPATYWDHSPDSPFPSIRENGTDYLLTAKRVCDYLNLYKRSDRDFSDPYFAPLAAQDFSRQPRTLIITAEFDPLRDEGEEYGRCLAEAGNEVEVYRLKDALHGFLSLGQFNQHVKMVYSLANNFLNFESPEGMNDV